ncbi:uncharacterized protein LOC131860243 [Cryptomeria japonica]|uniref:uncharacterized protein LOC131860243 n=1 Tax=Cryptomeria japonica TaxID=3369 RepID=UPI0027DA8E08|nr:uncharacterized protein LOC131860243 [Cryptomeria japonica]
MEEEESIAAYFLRVDEVVNALKGLGDTVEDKTMVHKILRTLPLKFDVKVSVVEEMLDLNKLTIDKLYGILTAYEMRTNVENPSKRETTFKASKKGKEKEQKSSESSEEDSEDEVAHLVRKLKRGSGKYKGKLPLKCFNYGKIGHFASKCPYEKEEGSDDERDSKFKNSKKFVKRGKKFQRFKKSLYSKEDSDSFLSSEEENHNDEILFMVVEDTQEVDYFDEEDVEVDLEQELISALNEIKILKSKNQNLKFLLQEENGKVSEKMLALEAAEKMVTNLKNQIEESKKVVEDLRKQHKAKEATCEKLEREIVSLRKLEKSSQQFSKENIFQNNVMSLDDLLNSQKQSLDKSGVDHDEGQCSKSVEAIMATRLEIAEDFLKEISVL